jgi:hypothetical protein
LLFSILYQLFRIFSHQGKTFFKKIKIFYGRLQNIKSPTTNINPEAFKYLNTNKKQFIFFRKILAR